MTGGEADREVCKEVGDRMTKQPVNFAGQFSLQVTAALLDRAELLITNDTGVMHMATGLGIPLVALFGPTTRRLGFFPFRSSSKVVEKMLDCRPCSYHGTAGCPLGHFHCMVRIDPDEVIRSAEELLENRVE